jgi:hypothetical protein
MGTSSRVGIRKGNKIHSVRVNYDGHLDRVGKTLLKYYDTEEKVNELIKGGEIRSLEPEPEYYECNTYNDVRYDTDELIETTDGNFICDSFIRRVHKNSCEYYYLMENGNWFCGDTYGSETPISHKFVLLSDDIEIMKKDESDDD